MSDNAYVRRLAHELLPGGPSGPRTYADVENALSRAGLALVLTGSERPCFTHEELLAMWHTLSPADDRWRALESAVRKLDEYAAARRAARGADGR